MNTVNEITGQVFMMFLVMSGGVYASKKKIIDSVGSKQICSLLLSVVNPIVIINSYIRPFDQQLLENFFVAVVLAALVNGLSIAITTLLFRKGEGKKLSAYRISSVFSNSGFFAFPIISAVFGTDALFIGAAYIAVTSIFSWTYGVYLITGDKKEMSLKKAFLNPGTIGLTIGMAIFLTGINLPTVVVGAIGSVASLNSPLAMIVMGTFIVESDLVSTLKEKGTYLVCFARLVLIPVATIAMLALIPVNPEVLLIVLLCASCPTAVMSSMFAAMFGGDYKTSSAIIALTTILSVLTLPVVVMISQTLWA